MLAACFGLLLMSIGTVRAQSTFLDTNVFDDFDTGGATALYAGFGDPGVGDAVGWYGQFFGNTPMQCDPTVNAPNSNGDTNASGAMVFSIPSWNASGGTAVEFITFNLSGEYNESWGIDADLYTNISFDLMVSNTVPLSAAGDFGTLGVGFVANGTPRGGDVYGNELIPASAQGHWTHFVVPLPRGGVQNASTIVGWCLKYGQGETPTYPAAGQNITFWIDNLQVTLAPPPPPPTMESIIPAVNGMNLWMVGAGPFADTNQEEDIESATEGGNGWQLATGANPVTYALTIAPTPVPPAGFHTYVIINTDDLAAYRTDPDRAAISMAMLDIVSAGNGTATGSFRYRINDTNDYNATGAQNTNVYHPDTGTNGTLASVSGPLGGTWTLKFTSPSTGSIIAPGGAASPSFTLNATAVNAFSEGVNPMDANSQSLSLYLGADPGGTAGLGKEVVLTDFTMTGNASAFEDNFATDIGPGQGADWITGNGVSESVGTTVQIPVSGNGPDVYVETSLPATGYDILGSTTIPNSEWTLLTGTNAVDINDAPITDTSTTLALGFDQIVVIPLAEAEKVSTGVPTNQLYFEMIKNNGGLRQ